MKELFNSHRLALKIKDTKLETSKVATQIFANWHHLLSTTTKTEEQLQADFLNDIFGEVLGYAYKRGLSEFNLEKEESTQLDGKQPDGILGFFNINQPKEQQDVRVIIELKGQKANLDAKQNRDTKLTPVEQAFGYVSKYQKVEFVVVSNFKEIRLYQSHYQGKYHQFLMSELANQPAKQQEFYFLLCKHNLIGFAPHTGSIIKKLIDDQAKHETEIQNKFYNEYKYLREEFVNDILKQNQTTPDTAIAKVQKLFDRLLFVRFCEDNNLINKPFEKVDAGKALGLSLLDSLKMLFQSIDKGNPPHIHKFNGGLFAVDAEFNSLKINQNLLEKFINFLRLYHFKNDISVHILGHIFEQSLTDLETLKADLNAETHNKKEGKRKKDGIFYTPEYITKYIVAEALGGWLKEQKDALQLRDFVFYELPENKPKKWQNPNQELINRYKLYAEKLKSVKVLDPACGSGAFLVEVFNYLQNEWLELSQTLQTLGEEPEFGLFNYQNIYKSILQNNIYGVDLNSESVQITKLSLWLKTANSQDELTTLDNNIKIGNSLIDDANLDEKAFNWQQEFPFKFDVVVGNPPYVRQELFSPIKPHLQQHYSVYAGAADLYCYFYEKATQLLAPNGKLGFITSNKWMRANYGANLRQFILQNTKIQSFIDLGGQEVFKGVGVDANIIVYQKTADANDNYVFKVSQNLQDFSEFASNHLDKNCFNIATNNLALSIKLKIETIGTPLKDWDVKINRGILTGFNDAFIIDSKTKEELCLVDPKSAEIIKPILRGRDIGRYSTNWAGLWVINTHNGYKKSRCYHPPLEASNLQNTRSHHPPLEGGSKLQSNFGAGYNNLNTSSNLNFAKNAIYPSPKSQILGSSTLPQGEGDLDRENNISPSQNLQANSTLPRGEGDLDRGGDGTEYIPRIDVEKNYPAIFTFLQKFQNQLEKRADKGDHWTNLRNCAYLEEFAKEKIVYSEIVKQPQFYYDQQNFYLEATSFVMTGNNLKYLIAVLNSKPCAWVFKTFYAGGGLGSEGIRYKKVFLEQLPIPQISLADQQPFIEKAQKMLDLTKQLNSLSFTFLDYLKAKMGNPSKLSNKLLKWYNLPDDAFLIEINKLAKAQKLANFDERAVFVAFKTDSKKIKEIQQALANTDAEIDRAVYALYKLSEEEIGVVENL